MSRAAPGLIAGWWTCRYCKNASVIHYGTPLDDIECRYCVNRVIDCGGFLLRVYDERVIPL